MNLSTLRNLIPFLPRADEADDPSQSLRFARMLLTASDGAPGTERIHRQEQRYLVQDIAPLLNLLRVYSQPHEFVPGCPETEITSLYLDTPDGTWSKGNSSLKFRCRSYQDPALWWFEMKRRTEGTVDKWRRPMAVDTLPSLLRREFA